MIKILLAGKLLLPETEIETSYIILNDNQLMQFGPIESFTPPESGEVIDYSGYRIIARDELIAGNRVSFVADSTDPRLRFLELQQPG